MWGCWSVAAISISRRNRSLPSDGRQLGLEQLDGDAAVVLQVLGEKDDGHAAVAELPLDPVSIAERRRELLEEVHGPVLSAAGTRASRGGGT